MFMSEIEYIAFAFAVAAIALLSVCMTLLVQWGHACASEGANYAKRHIRVVDATIAATFLLIGALEFFSHVVPNHVHMTGTWIFTVHMFFAPPFLLLLIAMRFWVAYLNDRPIHKQFAYIARFLFVGVMLTGAYMLAKMLMVY